MYPPRFDALAIDVLGQALSPLGEVLTHPQVYLEPFEIPVLFTPGPPEPPPPPDPIEDEIIRTHPLDPFGGLSTEQVGRRVLGAALSPRGKVEFNKRIEPDNDKDPVILGLWFQPRPAPAPVPGCLKLLKRMGRSPSVFEVPEDETEVEVLRYCTLKQLNWENNLSQQGLRPRPNALLPPMWIIARQVAPKVLKGDFWTLRPQRTWPPGVYFTCPGMRQRVVVLPELPLERATAVLHLLGSAAQRARAVKWARDLPAADPDRERLLTLAARFGN